MASNINRVILTGNLTFDPELRETPSGMKICKLRVACNSRAKDSSGSWIDKPNFFDVTVFGNQGENAARYLSKGRPVAVDGRLEWREWEDKDTGKKRSAVSIIADSVQFLGSPKDDQGGGSGGYRESPPAERSGGAGGYQSHAASQPTGEDDIPF